MTAGLLYIVTRSRDGQTYQAGAINVATGHWDDHPFVMNKGRAEHLAEFLSAWDDGEWQAVPHCPTSSGWTGRRDGS